jgi:hypothetical protein
LAQTLAALPPLSHYTDASRSNPSLGGGAPTYSTADTGVLGAGAPSDAVPTVVEGYPSLFLVASFLSIVSIAVSGQNGFLSSPRSCRKKPRRIWCPTARASTTPRPAAMALPASISPALGKRGKSRRRRSSVDQRSRLKDEIPLRWFNPSCRSLDGQPSFNEIP